MDDYGVPGSLGLHKTTETEQRGAQATHRGWNHVTQCRISQKVRQGSRTINGYLILSREGSRGF